MTASRDPDQPPRQGWRKWLPFAQASGQDKTGPRPAQPPLKWYFALNDISLKESLTLWRPMILAAVASAKANTKLRPHFLYDGEEHPFLDELRKLDVTIVPCRTEFYDALVAYGADKRGYLRTASGAFLRTQIPRIETEDDFVLYTDCDVLFASDEGLADMHPALFACAPEFNQQDYVTINTGVMVMNVKALKADLPAFTDFIRANLAGFETYDQCAYRQYYAGRWDRLPIEYNWKPYWGPNPQAKIIHFHGPKPTYGRHLLNNPGDMTVPPFNTIFHWNVKGYETYVPLWEETARGAGA